LGAPAVAVGLGVLELALVRLAGPPGRQLEVLRQLDQVGADPLASVLALLALGAEGLAAYLLAVLGLRLLATVPGAIGRLAAGATALATPATVRRALDLLLGGALLAQATLTPLPARAAAAPPLAAAARAHPAAAPLPTPAAAAPPPAAAGAAWSRTGSGWSGTPAPLPPWLAEPPAAGGGPRVAAEHPAPVLAAAVRRQPGGSRARSRPDPSRHAPCSCLPTDLTADEGAHGTLWGVGPAASGAVVPES
jgi:hypothetical protein